MAEGEGELVYCIVLHSTYPDKVIPVEDSCLVVRGWFLWESAWGVRFRKGVPDEERWSLVMVLFLQKYSSSSYSVLCTHWDWPVGTTLNDHCSHACSRYTSTIHSLYYRHAVYGWDEGLDYIFYMDGMRGEFQLGEYPFSH